MGLKFQTPYSQEYNKDLKIKLTNIISRRIKELRSKRKLTQQQLADQTGMHLTYISHLEAGKYHPSTFVLWKVAQVLRCPLDKLVTEE